MERELDRIMGEHGLRRLRRQPPVEAIPERREAINLVYRRTTRGPITDDWFLDHLPAERRSFYQDGAGSTLWRESTIRYEIVNFINGARNALEIRNAVSAEFGLQPLDSIVIFLKDLERAGLLLESGQRRLFQR